MLKRGFRLVVTLTTKGNFNKAEKFLHHPFKSVRSILDRYGKMGVQRLQAATPKRTGLTANSWKYEIVEDSNSISVVWSNSNRIKGISIALILQYGHATRGKGYVQGIDYINPALRPVFKQMAADAWKEVSQ